MYIQITTHCNMSCAHCIFSCSASKRGDFMTKDTFLKALRHCEDTGAYVTIGGGEPTLHPKFWEFLGYALAADLEGIWMATNGSVKRTAKALAKLAKSGVLGCALSQDEWHDPIDPEVIEIFQDLEIRNVSEHIINKGAALENGVGTEDGCGCPDVQVKPDGSVHMCGCPDSLRLGGIEVLEDYALFDRLREVSEETDECGANLNETQRAYILGEIASLDEAA